MIDENVIFNTNKDLLVLRILKMFDDPRITELRTIREQARLGGGGERIATQPAKGKLTARERLDILLDPGTFNELEPIYG